MEKAKGTLDGVNATLLYAENENPDKVTLVCSGEFTKRACIVSGLVGVASTVVVITYYRLLKQLKENSK